MTRTTIQAMTVTAVLALAFGPSAVAGASKVTAQQHSFAMARSVAALGGAAHDRVIVVMKAQPPQAAPGTRAAARRTAAIASAQAPLLREVRASRATRIISYRLVNAFAATVSAAEAARLKASPNVGEVIRDVLIRGGSAPLTTRRRSAKPATGTGLTPHVIPGACGASGSVLLDPEALQATNTAALSKTAKTARSLGMTGAGVRVAFIADGLNPRNVNFIRADGRSVFDRAFGGDYEDFSGDGPGQVTGGAEAFLDANSIAGQGLHVYNVRDFSAQHDPQACNIRIEGVAPSASLVGLDVFGSFAATLESNFFEAISYAVHTDHVNVLNESFGSDPFPDSASLNALKLFNDAAVAAGTTVTVSTGDSGSTSTIGSPASDPKVISVGASTTFRFYAQTNYAAARYFATTGWLNDNVSSLSSGGFTQGAGTVSLVAPGDLGFASCSPNFTAYTQCTNLTAGSSPLELAGGTSESAPLTAGAAALVIQAYRQAHHGASPTPALVKQILTSTATDLGLPATEQGAGLLNSYKAVLLAESIRTPAGSPAPVGDSLLISRAGLTAVGQPGSSRSWQVKVTNAGADAQIVKASGRTFGPDRDVQVGKVRLHDETSPEFVDFQGLPDNYGVFHFTVRPGAARLDASIAYKGVPDGDPAGPVRLILVDPRGRFAADSLPQGTADFGNVDVRAPVPGVWTGVAFGITGFENGSEGVVPWRVATQGFAPFGTVTPAGFLLQPGQSQTVKVTAALPADAGDSSGAVVFSSNFGGTDRYVGAESQSIPVTLRAMVDLAKGGTFGGVLTGGNGRGPGIGQVSYFAFAVGKGHRSITADVSLTNDHNEAVGDYLIAPDGQALGFGENILDGIDSRSLSAYVLDPTPGTWTLAIDFSGPVIGDEVAQPFDGTIALDATKATAIGLPDSPKILLKRGVPVTVKVRVTNNGVAPDQYFLDPRLTKLRTFVLDSFTGQTFLLPLAVQPDWFVPTQAVQAQVTAKGTVPVEFDWGPVQGDPDFFAAPEPGNRASGTFTPAGGALQPGDWAASPDQLGPYPAPAPLASVTMKMTVTARAFDSAMTPSTGDLWRVAVDIAAPFDPLNIAVGQSRVIALTLRPNGAPGTVVRGDLYVDDFQATVPPYGATTGDELVAIPYAYKIK